MYAACSARCASRDLCCVVDVKECRELDMRLCIMYDAMTCDRWKRDRECVNVSTTDMSLFALKPVKGVWMYNCVCAVGEKRY